MRGLLVRWLMKIIDPQTYEIESGFKKLTVIGSWVLLGFVLFL